MNLLSFTCSFTVGMVLLFAGFAKLRTPWIKRRAALEPFSLIPSFLRNGVTHLLPWMELISGALAILPFFGRPVYLGIGLLFVAFTLVVAAEWGRGKPIHCGCFGESDIAETDPRIFFGRNLLLILACGIAATWPPAGLVAMQMVIAVLLSLCGMLAFGLIGALMVAPIELAAEKEIA